MGLGEHHPSAVGHELGGGRHVVEQERGERLGPFDEQAVGQPLELIGESLRRGRCGGAGAVPERPVEDQLAGRRHVGQGNPIGRQLGRWHELADRLDLVSPVVQSHRAPRGAREHVEHSASNGELPSVLDDVGPHIAQLDEALAKHVGRQLEACDELDRWRDAQGRDHALHRREHRGDEHERALGLAHTRDRRGTPGGDLRRGRDALVRQRLPRGQQRDPFGAEERLEVGGQRLCLAGPGRHGEHRRVQGGRDAGDDEVLARIHVCDDRPRSRQQELFEGFGRHERLDRVAQVHTPSVAVVEHPK